MRFILLGTAGYHPNERRHTAGVFLPDLGILFDAGSGLFRLREHLQTDELDVFLSHAHLDHIVGLTYFFSFLENRRMKRVTVHGEAKKLAAIQEHLFAPEIFPVRPPYHWQPLTSTVAMRGDARLTWFPLKHPGGSVGYRIDAGGRSLAYVTDTSASPTADYVKHLNGVEVLIHEANFCDGQAEIAEKTGHSCLGNVARVAAAANVGKLILTHFDPNHGSFSAADLAAARSIFPRLVLGEDGLQSTA